jgi:anti-sigma factor RsiW
MTCRECEDLILDEIDGRLAQQMQPPLARHLAACDGCRAFMAVQTDLDQSLRETRSPELSSRFAARVLAEVDVVRHDTPLFVRTSFLAELAGLAAVAGAGAFVVQHWFPRLLLGGPWVAATAILCVGAWLTLADPPTPTA